MGIQKSIIVYLTHLTVYYTILKIIYFKNYSMDKISDNAIQFFLSMTIFVFGWYKISKFI